MKVGFERARDGDGMAARGWVWARRQGSEERVDAGREEGGLYVVEGGKDVVTGCSRSVRIAGSRDGHL